MKVLCLLFAIFALLLSVRPCCADERNEKVEVVKRDTDPKQGRHQEDCQDEDCSPFFTCRACSGFMITQSGIQLTLIVTEQPRVNNTPYHQPDQQDVLIAIWQPPQLA